MTNCSEMAVCISIIEVKSIFKFILRNDHYGKCIVCPLDVALEAFSVDFISQSYKEMHMCTCSDIWKILFVSSFIMENTSNETLVATVSNFEMWNQGD